MIAAEEGQGRARATYRYVRIIVMLPAVWLIAAIIVVSLLRWPPYDSISDYYGGPMRDVFVGGLMACGICMVAYKGRSKLEDYALNFAGVNAFFVALVPNSFPRLLDEAQAAERTDTPPLVTSPELVGNLKIAVGLFLIVILVFLIVDWKVMKWSEFHWADQTRPANVLIALSWIAELALAGIVVAMVVGVETVATASVFTVVHFGAAALLVGNLSLAAASYASKKLHKPDEAPFDSPELFFQVVAVAMWLGIILGGVAILQGVQYSVLVTELWEIVLFVAFWVRATRIEWRLPSPRTRLLGLAANQRSNDGIDGDPTVPGQDGIGP